jgi:hypothetical protein
MCFASAALVGCGPHRGGDNVAAVTLSAEHTSVHVGETTRITAATYNLAGSGALKWSVSPNNAKITADSNNSQAAMFSANQPGTYIISAATQKTDGGWVTGNVDITVNGEPMR